MFIEKSEGLPFTKTEDKYESDVNLKHINKIIFASNKNLQSSFTARSNMATPIASIDKLIFYNHTVYPIFYSFPLISLNHDNKIKFEYFKKVINKFEILNFRSLLKIKKVNRKFINISLSLNIEYTENNKRKRRLNLISF